MDKLGIDDLELKGQRVLVRVDFNVPIKDGQVTNDARIRAALPTIEKIIQEGGKAILMSHLGRPKGGFSEEFSLKPVAKHLSDVLKKDVKMAPDCVGDEVKKMAEPLGEGDVLLLENTRFRKEETANDAEFAKQLAELADVYVDDAFGSVHRAHASTVGVAQHVKEAAAGYLLQKEVQNLGRLLESPEKPYVLILGGAKVSDKIKIIHNMVTRISNLLIGGGMAYTFLKAQGFEIGDSLVEEDRIVNAYNTLVVIKNPHPYKRVTHLLPQDHVIMNSAKDSEYKTHDRVEIPSGWKGVDIGPKTIAAFREVIAGAKTVFWNGPMGIFERDEFATGTLEVAKAVAQATDNGAFTVIGGGDSIAAVAKAGVADRISHISTGGGASLEFLAGVDLPGIEALTKAKRKPAKEEKSS